MGSKISEILSGYKESLDSSQERYEAMLENRLEGTKELYKEVLKTLIKQYPKLSENPGRKENLKNKIQSFFGGKVYRSVLRNNSFKYGEGRIGEKLSQLKAWLNEED